jgi:hypothetical protein
MAWSKAASAALCEPCAALLLGTHVVPSNSKAVGAFPSRPRMGCYTNHNPARLTNHPHLELPPTPSSSYTPRPSAILLSPRILRLNIQLVCAQRKRSLQFAGYFTMCYLLSLLGG